ncbi:MAG: AMP-binding protein [Clostridia bacterium]|nr:AMP-binding protein [Clostridia bacterium]
MKKELLHEKREFINMRDLVEWAGDEWGDRIAYSWKLSPADSSSVRISFETLRRDVRSLASELLSMGCAGRHCAVIGKMSYDWALMYFSLLSIGAVIVPLDKDWKAEELADTTRTADVEFLFCDEDISDKAEAIENSVSLLAPTVYMVAKDNERNVKTLTALGEMKFIKDKKAYFEAPIDSYALALLVFTSGTTGKGKGVMLSQDNVISDVTDVLPYIDYGKKTIGLLPPHHTYGSSIMILGHLLIGSEVYVSSGLRYITKELREQKPEHLVLVPLYLETFYRRILATVEEKGKAKLLKNMMKVSNAVRHIGVDARAKLFTSVTEAFGGKLKMVISGGAAINPEIVDFFESVGISTLNGYGITECSHIVAVNRSLNPVKGSVGTVLDIDNVKIDEPNEDGEGEILVKGSNVMMGYYKDEEATADAFDEDGYFRTGDYGRLDGNNLYITGRKKNLIILSNGKNVYPEEIENVISQYSGVVDVIVYEGQSRRGVEYNAIVAEIYPEKEFFEKSGIEDIKGYFKEKIAEYNKTAVPYKKVAQVKVRREEFPKNTLRKILRFKLDTTID